MKNTIFKWNRMLRKNVALAIFFLFISQLVGAQCTTTNFTVAKTNASCSSNGKITVTIPTSTDCTGWIAELVKQGGGGSSSVNFPVTGGAIDFNSLGPGNYDLRLTNGTTSINYSGNPIAITSNYVDMTYSFSTAPPSCPNSSDATVTATIGAGKGTGPFVYKLTRADGTVLTSTPQASRTYTFTGLKGNENVSLAITDQINGAAGCEVTVFRPSYTTANQTFAGLAFNDGVRAFNYYRNCSNTSSCGTIDLVVNLSNVTPARKAKLDENPMNAKIKLNGVFYPLTLAAYSSSSATAQYKYDRVATGGPILVHNMSVTATFVDICGDLTANSRVYMSDNYLHVYPLPFNDPATCTTKYALRVETFWDDINFRSINFCKPNTLKIQRRVSENPDYYVDVTSAEISPMPNANSNPLSLGYTNQNAIAWGRAEYILNQPGRYRIVAKDDCHEVERIVDVNQANPLLYGATVSEGASTLQGTSAINISFGTITYKSPINIKITRKDGAELKEINATGPLGLGGTKYVTFPINAVYTFTDNVARSYTISDLPLGEYNIEMSNGSGGCPALPTPVIRTINLTRGAEYAMLDGNNSTQDTPVKVELGCLGSSKIIFNMGKNAYANSSGSTELWTATPQGAPIAYIGSAGDLGNGTTSLSGTFSNLFPGNYLVRVKNIYGGYSPAEASVNKPAFGPWDYSVSVTIPEFTPLKTQTSTVFCNSNDPNSGIINVEITSGTVSYPLFFILYDAADVNAENPLDGVEIGEEYASVNIRSFSFENRPQGNYFVRTSTPCYAVDSNVTVSTSGNVPTAQTENSTICQGSPATLSIFTTKDLYTVTWTKKNDSTTVGTGSSIIVTPNVTTTYTAHYQLKSEYNCGSTQYESDVTVTVLPLNLNIDVTPTQLDLCGNTSPSITVKNSTTGFNYEVVDTNGNSFTPVLKKSGTGSDLVFNLTGYSLTPGTNLKIKPTSTNPNASCTATLDKVVAIVAGSKRADLTVTGSSVCPNIDGTITISGSESGVEYEVLRSNASLAPVLKKTGTGGNLVFTVPANQLLGASTVFTIRATSTNCTPVLLQNTAEIIVNAAPTADAGADFTKTCAQNPNGTNIGMQAEAGNTYAWTAVPAASLSLLSSSTVANPNANPIAPTEYTLTVTGANGCKASDKVSVTVNLAAPTVNLGADFSITCTTNPSGKTLGSTITGATYKWSIPTNANLATTATLPVNPSETTTYTLVATYTNTGCSATDSVIATVDKSRPTADAGTDFTKTCVTNPSGSTIGATAIAGQTYSWSPTLGLSNPLAANPNANPTATTTYTVTATKTATGCTTTDAVVVTVNTTVPTANAGTDFTKTCISNATGATIGVAPITGISYSWSPTTGLSDDTISNPNANPLVTTEYTLTTTNNASGCTLTDKVMVTVDKSTILSDAGTDFTKTCSTNAGGKLIGTTAVSGASYSWSPTTGLTNATTANPTASPMNSTTYTVTTTKTATGCTSTDSVVVTVDTTVPSSLTLEGIDQPSCLTDKGTIRINTTGVSTDSYSINGVDYQLSPIFTDILPNTYNITVKSGTNGCVSNAIAAVVNPQPPIPSTPSIVVNGATTFCEGGYVDLEGPIAPTGDTYTYQWFTSSGAIPDGTTRIYRTTLPETYTLVVTNSHSCSSPASAGIQVEVNNNPVATINNGVAIEFLNCTNTLTLTASVGASYQWALDGVLLAAPQGTARIFTATTPGSYSVTVTENSGCVATSQPTLLVPPPTIQPTSLETCAGNPIILNSNVTSFTDPVYQWKRNGVAIVSGGNNANYSASQDGDYTLQVTERNNSSVTATSCGVSVTINPLPIVNAGSDFTITCTANTTGRTIGENPASGFSYSWSPSTGLSNAAIANPIANPSATTTYILRKTNTATGCWSEANIVVTVNKMAPNAQAGTDFTKTCINYTSGNEIGVPAVSGVTYSWNPSLGLSDASLSNPIANPSATTTYTLTTTKSENGCTATDTVEVIVDRSVPVANAGADFTKNCSTYTTGKQIGVSPISGVTYSWTPSTGLDNTSIANPLANPSVTTTYTLTATKTTTGCTTTDSVIATVDTNVPIVSAGSDFTITCVSNTSGRTIGENPESGYSYVWSPSTGLSNTNSANPVANPTITTTYTVRKTNSASGCWSEASCTVTVNKATPIAQAGTDFTKTCVNNTSGKEIGVVGVTGVSYSWSPALGLSDTTVANPIANPIITTIYTLTTTNRITGCTATDSVEVVVDKTLPVADAGSDFTKTCATNSTGKQIGVTAVAGVTYSWSPSAGLSNAALSNPIANPTVTTTYTIIATKTATGCTASDSVTATVNSTANPIATSVRLDNNCPSETVDLMSVQPNGANGVIYEWWTGTTTTRETQITNITNYNTTGNVYLWSKTSDESCYNAEGSEVAVVITPCCAANVGVIQENNPFYLLHYAPADITTLEHINFTEPSIVNYVLVNNVDGKIKQINSLKPEFTAVLAGDYTVHALVFGPTATPTGIEIGNKLAQIQPFCGTTATFSLTVLSQDCSSAPSFSQTISNAKQYALLDLTSGNFVQVNTTGEFTSIFTGIPHQIIGFNYTGTASGIVVGGTIAGVSASNLDITVGMVFTGCAPVTTQIDGIIYNDVDKNCNDENDTQDGLPRNTIYLKLLNSNKEVVQVTSTNADAYYYFSFNTDLFDGTYSIIVDDNANMTDSVSNYPSSWKGNSQTFTIEFGQIVEYLSNTANFVPMCMQSATEKPAPKRTPNLQGNTYHFCKDATTSSLSVDAISGAVVNWYTNATGGDASSIAPTPNTTVVGVKTCYVSQTINGAESERTEINIEVHALPEQPTVISGDDFVGAGTSQTYSVVNAASALSYNWILPSDWTGSSTTKDINVVVGNKSTTIGVTSISSYGCVSPIQQLDVRVVIEDDIEVYNSISPNSDGDNDIFRIRNIDFYPENTLSIYNRWGVEVYHVNSYGQNDNFFKGLSDGRSTVSRDVELPEGTYFYTLTYKNTKGIEKNLSGYLYIKQ